jgi:hypothetical protein
MEYIGLLFELIFFAIGFFSYRFAMGKIRFSASQQPAADSFRKENGGWMRILGLALTAIMSIEIVLHIFQLFKITIK